MEVGRRPWRAMSVTAGTGVYAVKSRKWATPQQALRQFEVPPASANGYFQVAPGRG